MDDEQQELAQRQEMDAMERAFAEGSGLEVPAPTVAPASAAAGAQEPQGPERAEAETSQESASGADDEADNKTTAAEDDDPVLLDGLKRSELRRLLGNAAEVESLKRMVDKAHGNIGDLNRKLSQQAAAMPAAASNVAAAKALAPEQMQQFEADYPDIAQYVRALGLAPAQTQSAPPADVTNTVATVESQAAQAGHDTLAIELAVMDRMHNGWRDKVQSSDFNTWLASQGEQAKTAFETASTADGLASVIGQFDQWAAAREAAAQRAAKGQQRLQKATTPSGNAPRPQAAPTENEAMEAAFNAAWAKYGK